MAGTVLITGGAGFIGCALAHVLVERGADVAVLDSLHPQVHAVPVRPARLPAGATLLVGDVTRAETWREALAHAVPDTVVHLAAETGTGQSLRAATRHGLANVVGTTQLMDALRDASHLPGHVVLASSRAVYGEGEWCDAAGTVFAPGARSPGDLLAGRWDPRGPSGLPAHPLPHRAATTTPRPVSVYAATKLAQEHLLTAWGSALSVAVTVLRLQNVYGPGQSLTNGYAGVLAHFARLAVDGRVIEVYEDGEISRDFVYVDDVAGALATTVLSGPPAGHVVDVGLGRPVSLLAVARAIAATADAPPPVVSGRFREGDVRAASCDITAAAAALHYQPAWSLERGLDALVTWVQGARYASDSHGPQMARVRPGTLAVASP